MEGMLIALSWMVKNLFLNQSFKTGSISFEI